MTLMQTERLKTFPEMLWAGTEHSLNLAMEAYESLLSKEISAGIMSGQAARDEEEAPYLFSKQGDVGVVSIRGALVNRDSPYNRYFGLTSYSDIRRAVIHGATKAGVKAMLLDIESGGGAVSGLADTGNLISMVNEQVMPVYAFSDGLIASAAYWLGSSAGRVYNSKTAIVGSIGVITTHMEVSKMLKEAGVGVTVMRAGKYKALVNQFEPLSETAQKQLQDQLNASYEVFAQHVVDRRNTTMDTFEKTMGQGREFFGEAAVNANLTDGITTFDALMSKINASLLDKEKDRAQNPSSFMQGREMPRQALTEQQIAALAAGAASVQASAAGAEAEASQAAEEAKAEAKAEDTKVEDKAAAEVTEAAKGTDSIVDFLKAQVAEGQKALVTVQLQLSQAQAKVTTMEATHAGLLKIALASLSNMKVALGGSVVTEMSAEALLAEHAATSVLFAKRFVAGGVAAVTGKDGKAAAADLANDPFRKAQIAATQI